MQENSQTIICDGSKINFRIENVYSTFHLKIDKILWKPGPNMTLISGQGTGNASFRSNGNGNMVVSAYIEYIYKDPNLSYGYTREKEIWSSVWVGAPNSLTFKILNIGQFFPDNYPNSKEICINTPNDGIIHISNNNCGITEFGWSYPYNWIKQPHPMGRIPEPDISKDQYVQFVSNGKVTTNNGFTVRARNQCGWGEYSQLIDLRPISCNNRNYSPGGEPLSSPTDLLDMAVKESIISLRVYSVMGALIYSSNMISDNFDINSLGLNKNTFYIIEKIDINNNIKRDKILIK